MSEIPVGLLLADDLLFVSRITGTARSMNLAIQAVRSPQDLLTHAEKNHPRCVLLDLQHPGLDIGEAVKKLKGWGNPFLVGYGSHVDAALLSQARAAGCDLVLPRSKFVEELPKSLANWFVGQDSNPDV